MTTIAEFVAELPKVELHVHHVGSASPRAVAQLAARHAGSTPVPADEALLAEYFTFRDFAHFIEVYLSVVDLLRDPADIWTLTYETARDLARQHVRYAELTLTPYSSIVRGIAAEAFCEAVEDARAAGLHSVPHAGESTGAPTVWEAVTALGAERIGHGIRAVDDPALLQYLAQNRIPLEICPTSNVRTRSVPSLTEHPLPTLVAAGVQVSINSDDPPMFSTTLNDEYLVAAQLLELDSSGVAELARGAVRQSFLDDAGKSRILDEIDAHAAGAA